MTLLGGADAPLPIFSFLNHKVSQKPADLRARIERHLSLTKSNFYTFSVFHVLRQIEQLECEPNRDREAG